MDRIIILEENDICLSVPEIEDIDLWYKWVNDIENQSLLWSMFWTIISYKSEQDFFYSLNKDDSKITFSIFVNSLKKSIWNISLFDIDYKNSRAEIWIAIFDKNNQWKWFWTLAMKLIQKYAFEVLWLNKIYLKYIWFNKKAWKVYSNVWFIEVWTLKNHEYRLWKYHDLVIMELFKKDYIKND